MKSNQSILAIATMVILLFTGCKKDNGSAQTTTSASNKFKELKTLSQLIADLGTPNKGTITIQAQNSSYNIQQGGKASSFLSGIIYQSEPSHNYLFQIDNIYKSPEAKVNDLKWYKIDCIHPSDFNYIYGTTQSYSLLDGSNNVFTCKFYTPTLINAKSANMSQDRKDFYLTWNIDPNNSLGVIIKIDMYDPSGNFIATDAKLVSDNGKASISDLLANHPDQKTFNLQVIRGNYNQVTLHNGDLYNVIAYSFSLQSLSFQ